MSKDGIQIQVKGLDEVMAKIDQLVPDLQKQLLNKTGPDLAQVMYAVAAQNAPVARVNGGRLRQSLQTGESIVELDDGTGEVFIGITTNVPYARYVEYGTGNKGDPSVPHVPKDYWWSYNPDYDPSKPEGPDNRKFFKWYAQEPNPFMRNALRSTRKIAVRYMKEGADAVFKQ